MNQRISFGLVGGLVASLWASLELTVQVLLCLMCLDIATGMLAAAVEGQLSSAVGWRGLVRKVTTLLLVAAAHFAEPLLGGVNASLAVAGFYCATEFLSIVEHSGRAGVPVPGALKQAIVALRDRLDQSL